MTINSSHEFTPEEINLIEKQFVDKVENGRRVMVFLTLADVREILERFSVNKEGSAELTLVTAISAARELVNGKNFILQSYLDNEVSDEEARPSKLPSDSVEKD